MSADEPTGAGAALLRRLIIWSGRATAASALFAAGGFAGSVAAWGRWMAVGLALYGGTLEPDEPDLPFPLAAAFAPLGLALLCLVLEPILKKSWLSAAAIALAMLSAGVTVQHLLELVEIAAG